MMPEWLVFFTFLGSAFTSSNLIVNARKFSVSSIFNIWRLVDGVKLVNKLKAFGVTSVFTGSNFFALIALISLYVLLFIVVSARIAGNAETLFISSFALVGVIWCDFIRVYLIYEERGSGFDWQAMVWDIRVKMPLILPSFMLLVPIQLLETYDFGWIEVPITIISFAAWSFCFSKILNSSRFLGRRTHLNCGIIIPTSDHFDFLKSSYRFVGAMFGVVYFFGCDMFESNYFIESFGIFLIVAVIITLPKKLELAFPSLNRAFWDDLGWRWMMGVALMLISMAAGLKYYV